MRAMPDDAAASRSVADRLLDGAIELLVEQGPAAIKARTVGAAAGMSSMVVYSHFGGVPELVQAMADRGFEELGNALAAVPATDDPILDLFMLAATCREVARANPHLYDLMFGLSSRATYRPTEASVRLSGHSPAFRAAYAQVLAACDRLVRSGRIDPSPPEVVAAQLWSFVHGFISLELADHFVEFDDPIAQVLIPMGVTFSVGLGDTLNRAQASHEQALRRYQDSGSAPTIADRG